MATVRRLCDTDVRTIFDSVVDHRLPPPHLQFQVIPFTSLKMAPPSVEFEEGLYLLLKPQTKHMKDQHISKSELFPVKIPPYLNDHVADLPPPGKCIWALSGARFKQPTKVQQRYCTPKNINGDPNYCNNHGGALWTMYDSDGKEKLEFRLLHVYSSIKKEKVPSTKAVASILPKKSASKKMPPKRNKGKTRSIKTVPKAVSIKKKERRPKKPPPEADEVSVATTVSSTTSACSPLPPVQLYLVAIIEIDLCLDNCRISTKRFNVGIFSSVELAVHNAKEAFEKKARGYFINGRFTDEATYTFEKAECYAEAFLNDKEGDDERAMKIIYHMRGYDGREVIATCSTVTLDKPYMEPEPANYLLFDKSPPIASSLCSSNGGKERDIMPKNAQNDGDRISQDDKKKLTKSAFSSSPSKYPKSSDKNRPKNRRWKYEVQPHMYITDSYTDIDVLLGRGGRSNQHKGNKRYLAEVSKMQTLFRRSTKEEKTVVADQLVEIVNNYGGRFLKQDLATRKWYVVPQRAARRKASQALREHKPIREPKPRKNARQVPT